MTTWNKDTIVKPSNPPKQATNKMADNSMEKQVNTKMKGLARSLSAKATPNGEKFTIAMTFKKDTPGTYVYASDDPDAVVTQLYVKKSAYNKSGRPETITLVVDGG